MTGWVRELGLDNLVMGEPQLAEIALEVQIELHESVKPGRTVLC